MFKIGAFSKFMAKGYLHLLRKTSSILLYRDSCSAFIIVRNTLKRMLTSKYVRLSRNQWNQKMVL